MNITTKTNRMGSLSTLAALTLTMSLAAFGCSSNKYPGNGEPGISPMGGPASTPGSSSGATPGSMTSSSDAGSQASSVDAIAILEADAAYRGKILGTAAPGTATQAQASTSAQPVTGQFQSPTGVANPQPTVNSSVSSSPVQVITSGAGGVVGEAEAPVTTTGVTTSAVTSATTPSAITSATAPAGNTAPVLSTPFTHLTGGTNGVIVAPSATSGSTMALPSVAPALPTSPTTSSVATNAGRKSGATSTSASTTQRGATAPVTIGSTPAGGVVVTNQSPSLMRRFLSAVGIRRAATAPPTTTTP